MGNVVFLQDHRIEPLRGKLNEAPRLLDGRMFGERHALYSLETLCAAEAGVGANDFFCLVLKSSLHESCCVGFGANGFGRPARYSKPTNTPS